MDKFFTAVQLDEDLCKGCINCIKRCPTQAIRVRKGRAVITKEFCIDCGECIRVCPHHAKKAVFDGLDILEKYEYTVALPAPTLYGQLNNLDDINIVLTALKHMGFDDVYEVSGAAELVSEISRQYVEEHKEQWPIISTACPSIVRLIRVRFPNLIPHLLPVQAPVDLAAAIARRNAMEKTHLPSEKIGIIFISPCPAKVSAARHPLGIEKSNIDGVLAIKSVYPKLINIMPKVLDDVEELAISGRIGIGWGICGGEASGLLRENYLAADGIENVIRVLEDLEDEKFSNLEFIELNACSGGCVGGVLTVENPYVAEVKMKRLVKYMPVARTHLRKDRGYEKAKKEVDLYWNTTVEYEPVFRLGKGMRDNINKMTRVEELCQLFPALDCGACGAPTCQALAEDIVRGAACEQDCMYVLRQRLHKLSDEISMLDRTEREEREAGIQREGKGEEQL